ncbi:MAG: sigma-70 family RNA polymerase sigma factor [Ferruginibacter sp.]
MQQNTENQQDVHGQVAAVLANDEKTLEALYTANFYKTESYIIANSGTSEEAKDIYQEAFIASWQNIKAGRFVPRHETSLEAYIFQVAKYKWLDHLKSTKRNRVVPVEDNFVATADDRSGEEEKYIRQVQHHFTSMGEPCKQVLTLFYFMKKSMNEIAIAFSWTEATAKNNKYRCLQRLRNMVVGNNK